MSDPALDPNNLCWDPPPVTHSFKVSAGVEGDGAAPFLKVYNKNAKQVESSREADAEEMSKMSAQAIFDTEDYATGLDRVQLNLPVELNYSKLEL